MEGYAGAGLYESITMDVADEARLDYASDEWLTNESKRTELLARICKVGHEIEEAFGSAQDVEGVVEEDGTITVVQTRPQGH